MSALTSNVVRGDLRALHHATDTFKATERMPAFFLGHGNPMNALEDNVFTRGFESVRADIPKPKAILCISAHWETNGTYVTAMERPQTIHDFGGFPKALFDVNYPAPGSPELALETQQLIKSAAVGLNDNWGLDHGCWAVAKFLFPEADVPIVEMSIDYTKPAAYHYALGKELAALRRKGVMIMGSGNTVHNLRLAAWSQMMTPGYAYDWATIANEKIKGMIIDGDHQSLIDFDKQGIEMKMAVPTPEHYLPILYTLALQEKDEQATLFNDGIVAGSLNMLSVKIG